MDFLLKFGFVSILLGWSIAPAHAASTPASRQLEITPFTVAKGMKLPDGYLASMTEEISRQLQHTTCFGIVYLQSQTRIPLPNEHRTLLSGQISDFEAGNRAARLLSGGPVGYAASKGGRKGQADATAHVKFVDSESGQVLAESDVHAVLRNNPLNPNLTGGNAKETGKGLAREIAKLAGSQFGTCR